MVLMYLNLPLFFFLDLNDAFGEKKTDAGFLSIESRRPRGPFWSFWLSFTTTTVMPAPIRGQGTVCCDIYFIDKLLAG